MLTQQRERRKRDARDEHMNQIDMIALEAARSVEDEFAKGHPGGACQRQASVQVIITAAINRAFDCATDGLLRGRSVVRGE
jgi:hypothetical protein